MSDTMIIAFALLTGIVTGALFRLLQVPIPAPPNLAGILGIVGIYLGYKFIDWLDVGIDLMAALGVQ